MSMVFFPRAVCQPSLQHRLSCQRICAGSGQNGQDDYQGTPDMDDERWTTSYWTQYTVLLSRAARVKRFQAFATKV